MYTLLLKMGVLTETDGLTLERLCDCYADILACRKLVERDGHTYTSIDQNSNTLIKNSPAVNRLRGADAQFKSYLVEFGLTRHQAAFLFPVRAVPPPAARRRTRHRRKPALDLPLATG